MTDFSDFPDGDGLWVIRHIDGYIRPHKGTDSTSVRCFLVAVPPEFGTNPANFTTAQISALFCDAGASRFTTTIFAGALPSYVVGFAFRRGKYVGSLPAIQLSLGDALSQGEASGLYKIDPVSNRARGLSADTVISKSAQGYPTKVLPTTQLYLEAKLREQTQFLVVQDRREADEASQIQFLIPRSVIFRTFYASTSLRAELFTAGVWSLVKDSAIYTGEFAGNRTAEDPETGRWNVVLQLGMEEADFYMMALFHFDEYAKAAADRLHTPQLVARDRAARNGDKDLLWHSNAEIPFDPRKGPYTGTVSGYYLVNRRDRHFNGRTFLVTAIHAISPPKGNPEVGGILINDAGDGEDISTSADPRPFGGSPRKGGKRPDGMANVDTHHASTREPALALPSASFTLDPPPAVHKLTKNRSTRYTSPRQPAPQDPTSEGSSGSRNGDQGSKSPLNSSQVDRAPSEVFAALMSAMEDLRSEGLIRAYSAVQPTDSLRRVSVGGYACWNFLDKQQLHRIRHGRAVLQRRSWAYLRGAGPRGAPVERAALVLRVELKNGRYALWIEIETQAKESFSSALVMESSSGTTLDTDAALRLIRNCKGVAVSRNLSSNGVECYSHPHFRDSDRKSWSKDPLQSFIDTVTGFSASSNDPSIMSTLHIKHRLKRRQAR